ncbi:MAG: conjugative transposon protein TraN [Rikenellaceae bacterium]
MRKYILIAALTMGVFVAEAQETIAPYTLEVTHNNTTHIIFPDGVAYVDLGSANLIAGKVDGAENVVRVKSANMGFTEQTNMSVITNNGSFYSFDVVYAEQPQTLSVEMVDFLQNRSGKNNALDVKMQELGEDTPMSILHVMKAIYDDNRTYIRGVGSCGMGIDYSLKSIYINSGVLYFHTELINRSAIRFDIDHIVMKIVDRKVAKRTAMQEQVIFPLRSFNNVQSVDGGKRERTIYAIEKFTIPENKQFIIELHERNGGRHQTIKVRSREILSSQTIKQLK